MKNRECQNCKFSAPLRDDVYGEPASQCRRNPPTVINESWIDGSDGNHTKFAANRTFFPIVGNESWCGEFVSKTKDDAK
jgi:hypothetical protein